MKKSTARKQKHGHVGHLPEVDEPVTPAPAAASAEPPAAEEPAQQVAAEPEPKKIPASVEASLREQFGGDEAIEKAVAILSEKLSTDPRFNFFLFGMSRDDHGDKHRTFLSVALGGQDGATKADLMDKFSRLFDQGLQDRHFDVVLHHLRDTMKELDFSDDLTASVLTASGETRKSLFCR